MSAPRLGFLGVGWIGRHRLEAINWSGLARIAAIADPCAEATAAARRAAPFASVFTTIDDLLTQDLDGIVIATPSGLHAVQSMTGLESGLAVFCQKPLARTASEATRIVDSARTADRLLGVDLSYRHLNSAVAVRDACCRRYGASRGR